LVAATKLLLVVPNFVAVTKPFFSVVSLKSIDTASFFSSPRKFGTERDTSDKHGIKLLNLREIYQFDFSFLVVFRSVSKLQRFEKVGAIITFETSTRYIQRLSIPAP